MIAEQNKSIVDLQLSVTAKKNFKTDEFMKRLHPLAESVYHEVLLAKYKGSVLTKFDGDGNPWDYIIVFELECIVIASNNKCCVISMHRICNTPNLVHAQE